MVFLTLVSLNSNAEAVSAIKAAELACHRIDRLVVLKKIDKSFLSKFQKIDLIELTVGNTTEGKFEITTYQTAPTVGEPLSLSIVIDENGKVLKHQINDGGTAGPQYAWTGKDPVTLVETGLHYIIEEQTNNVQLRPFAIDFKSILLTQKKLYEILVAEIIVESNSSTAKLVLTIDLSGKLLSQQVIP